MSPIEKEVAALPYSIASTILKLYAAANSSPSQQEKLLQEASEMMAHMLKAATPTPRKVVSMTKAKASEALVDAQPKASTPKPKALKALKKESCPAPSLKEEAFSDEDLDL